MRWRRWFLLGYRVFGLRRAVIRGNLERSFPDRSDASDARSAANSYVASREVLAELDYARRMPADEFRQRVRLIDSDRGSLRHRGRSSSSEPTSATSNGCCCGCRSNSGRGWCVSTSRCEVG